MHEKERQLIRKYFKSIKESKQASKQERMCKKKSRPENRKNQTSFKIKRNFRERNEGVKIVSDKKKKEKRQKYPSGHQKQRINKKSGKELFKEA